MLGQRNFVPIMDNDVHTSTLSFADIVLKRPDQCYCVCVNVATGTYAEIALRLAAAIKFLVADELTFLRYATPTTWGGCFGVSGRTFKREPLKRSKPC
jgi:hypothetical protein